MVSITASEEVFINDDGETSRDFCYIGNAMQMNIVTAMAQNEVQAIKFITVR